MDVITPINFNMSGWQKQYSEDLEKHENLKHVNFLFGFIQHKKVKSRQNAFSDLLFTKKECNIICWLIVSDVSERLSASFN